MLFQKISTCFIHISIYLLKFAYSDFEMHKLDLWCVLLDFIIIILLLFIIIFMIFAYMYVFYLKMRVWFIILKDSVKNKNGNILPTQKN